MCIHKTRSHFNEVYSYISEDQNITFLELFLAMSQMSVQGSQTQKFHGAKETYFWPPWPFIASLDMSLQRNQ